MITNAAPTAAGRADGYLFVFAKAANGQIMYNQAGSGGAFVGWQAVPGGQMTSTAVGAGEQGTTLVLFAKNFSRTHCVQPGSQGRHVCRLASNLTGFSLVQLT